MTVISTTDAPSSRPETPSVSAGDSDSGTAALPPRQPLEVLRGELRHLLSTPGPFLSLYLDLNDDEAAMTARADIAATAGLTSLQRERAHAVMETAQTDEDQPETLALLIGATAHAVARTYDEPIDQTVMTISDVPRIAPLIEAEERLAHHIVAVVDGTELELLTFPRHRTATAHRTNVGHGGMSRFVELIVSSARTTDTDLVVLCAPEEIRRALEARVRTALPFRTSVTSIPIDDVNVTEVADVAVAHVAHRRASEIVELLRLETFAAAHGLVESGMPDAVRAMRSNRPRRLFVHDDPTDERTLWFGADATMIALDLEDAAAVGFGGGLLQGRRADVLIRSALLRDTSVHIVPDLPDTRLPDGVSVVLTDDHVLDLGDEA